MQIVLLYPPPWKISSPVESSDLLKDGPPRKGGKNILNDGDFVTAPYGLLSLAAQALRAGHSVLTFNLSNFPWREIEILISHIDADLFGMSCHAANRRGAAMLAQLIREEHPKAHIVCGGPFVTALPVETLKHYEAIETLVIGEGEETFLELILRLENGLPIKGLAGTAWRSRDSIHIGPPRKRIENLDSLASPLDYFPSENLITSRGCPGECTFCGSKGMWGRKVTFHSVDFVLDMFQTAVEKYGQQFLSIVDDTFTVNRKRALAICQGIVRRKLNFIWSCHTRVDRIDEELLYFMRIAGCQRISFGVESASPVILKNIKKNTSPEIILNATRLAKKYGFEIRYFMMFGNRGETVETLRQSLDFIKKAKPHSFTFFPLSIFPGTEEFEILKNNEGVMSEIFFEEDFLQFNKFAGRLQDERKIQDLVKKSIRHRGVSYYSVEDLKKILKRLPNNPAVHMDLGGAYWRKGDCDEAEKHVRLALELSYPLPGLAFNYLAAIAAAKQDFSAAMLNLVMAYKIYPHEIVCRNMNLLSAWRKGGGIQNSRPLVLDAHNLFESGFIPRQPETPGPIKLNVRSSKEVYNLGPDFGLNCQHGEPLHVQC